MFNSSHSARKAILASRLATLAQDLTIANNQYNSTGNNLERERLKRQMDDILRQMQEAEEELKEFERGSVDPNRRFLNWHSTLPRINFKEAVAITSDVILECRSNCAALFLLQNGLSMGGKWCVERIRELLMETTLDFKPYDIEFTTSSQPNERGMLDMLARYVNVEPSDDPVRYARAIIEKMHGSLQSGSVVFIELRGVELIYDPTQLLNWFVEHFWVPYVRELPRLSKMYSRLRIVVIISADEPLPPNCVPAEISCTRDKFNSEKILELPLQNWTSDEIQEWLESYSGMNAQDILVLTRRIYNASSKGLPALVYQALAQHLPAEGYR